jgi:hypothetical protein
MVDFELVMWCRSEPILAVYLISASSLWNTANVSMLRKDHQIT